jgi:hypothetical protein
MKKPVMQRSMFIAMAPKSESKGIVSGFDEEMENEDYEDRTPENLEIIANNLRGDIRSMDERYMELAQLVGEAAFDTPEEVVALMQAQMGQGQQAPMTPPPTSGGIAGLGAAPAMPQQAAGIVPEQAPAEEQPPVQMAQGGVVYRQAGSPPGGEISRSMQTALMNQNIANMMLSGPAKAMGDLSQQQSPFLTRISQQAFQPVTRLAGQGVNLLNQARPYYTAMGPYGRGLALGTAGVLPGLTYLAGQEPPPEGGPVFSEVPGVDAQGRYRPVLRSVENMPGTPEEKAAVRQMGLMDIQGLGMADIGAGPTPEQVLNVTAPTEEPAAAAAPTTAPAPTRVAPTQVAPKSRTFKERVQDRIDIYKDVLGDDENMRQAQALFLLAESALNVAGARGRSVGERLTTGLKGLPSALGALGAEKAKRDLAVRTAAVSAVEQEMAAEARSGTQLAIKLMELDARNADIKAMADYLVQTQGFSPEKAFQVARLKKANGITNNEAGELVDLTGRVILSPFRLTEGDVGFLPADGSIPFVSVGKRSLVPATAKDRPALATELGNNQSMAAAIERVMQLPSFESMVGPIAKIQSGVTSVLTPFFGANIPFTDLAKDVQKNIARELRNELITLNARNTSRPSVWEQKQVEKFIADPDAILTSPEEFFGILNNFRVKAINRANEIEHQLTGQPLKQLEYIPMGTAKDPLQAKDSAYLNEFFRLRPNGSIFIQLPNERAPRKFTAQEWFSQTRTQ